MTVFTFYGHVHAVHRVSRPVGSVRGFKPPLETVESVCGYQTREAAKNLRPGVPTCLWCAIGRSLW